MGLLRVVAASLALTACYEPQLRDCTLACNAEADCADGQVCGSDRLCATPEIAGRCDEMPGAADSTGRDAGLDDALGDAKPDATTPPADAATHVPLEIKIDGKGRVNVTGYGHCDAAPPVDGACTIVVPNGALRTISADAHPGWRFDRWTTAACASTSINTCTFIPNGPTPIGVKFKNNGGGND